MAYQIRKAETVPVPAAKPKKNKDYLSFLHKLPCAVTGQTGVEAAHLSYSEPQYGHYGRGRGTKAPDRWALPLCPYEHRRQHSMNEEAYWLEVGITPHVLALTIWGLWSDYGDEAEQYAEAVIRGRL